MQTIDKYLLKIIDNEDGSSVCRIEERYIGGTGSVITHTVCSWTSKMDKYERRSVERLVSDANKSSEKLWVRG